MKDQTASEKIQAISYNTQNTEIQKKLAYILIESLKTDDNINVRLAALDALSQFSEEPFIRNSLINSLDKQENPNVQISLINLLAEFNTPDAFNAINMFLNQTGSPPEVKTYAKELIYKKSI